MCCRSDEDKGHPSSPAGRVDDNSVLARGALWSLCSSLRPAAPFARRSLEETLEKLEILMYWH